MHDLIPITALGGTAPQIDAIADLTIAECPDWALASVACRLRKERALGMAFKKAMGVALPKPTMSVTQKKMTVFWTGPGQYFVEAPFATHELIAYDLAEKLKKNASVTEQTDGWVRFDLTGEGCSDVFERLCPLNTRSMADGAVSRTSIEHTGCFVLRRKANHFSVYGPRSTAGSIHHALVTAAQSALD